MSGPTVVVKLTHRRFADDAYLARLDMLDHLASIDTTVVGARSVDEMLATEIGCWFGVVYPMVVGRHPDNNDPQDVDAMASALVGIHRSLATVDAPAVPRVAALRSLSFTRTVHVPDQLLHGDFSSSNVVLTERGARIIDFDDAGHGPLEFDLGNTLYMALFDATLHERMDEYRRFRSRFLDGYDRAAGTPLRRDLVDDSIELRKRALRAWLDDLSIAPIGIRTASPEWRLRLRRFVEAV